MFVSPFTVSLACDAAVIVVYLEDAEKFGGTPWFAIEFGKDYTSEMVDIVSDLCCYVQGACFVPLFPLCGTATNLFSFTS